MSYQLDRNLDFLAVVVRLKQILNDSWELFLELLKGVGFRDETRNILALGDPHTCLRVPCGLYDDKIWQVVPLSLRWPT
jgi:hypothetical protein